MKTRTDGTHRSGCLEKATAAELVGHAGAPYDHVVSVIGVKGVMGVVVLRIIRLRICPTR